MSARILVVDDDDEIRAMLDSTLRFSGFEVTQAATGADAIAALASAQPDAVVLDVTMPGVDGFEVVQLIRRRDATLPVLFLSARDAVEDRVRGLRLGGDDYVTKPFSARELVSRINAVLRRVELSSPAERSSLVQVDDRLQVDFDNRLVLVEGEPVKLRPTEYRLLHYFIQNPGRMLSHEQLLSRVWGPEYVDDNQLLRLYVAYLRQKIEPDPSNPRYIFNERGIGYRFVDFRDA